MSKTFRRATLGAALVLMAGIPFAISGASANHFAGAGTSKTCTSSGNSINFGCTFVVQRGPDAGDVQVGDPVHVHLTGNAEYTNVSLAPGGTCNVTLGAVTANHISLTVVAPGCAPGSSFTLNEQLKATGAGGGQVCQSPDEHGDNAPVLNFCAPNFTVPAVIGPPTSTDECKNGGWATFNNPPFKNQGDCVSFVATGGRNPAAG